MTLASDQAYRRFVRLFGSTHVDFDSDRSLSFAPNGSVQDPTWAANSKTVGLHSQGSNFIKQ